METTTNQVEDFKVYRPKEGGPDDQLKWRTMRRGVADLNRRAEISQHANERYLNALSTVDDSTPLWELVRRLEPCQLGTRRVRALHPFSAEDHALLEAVNRGEFTLHGLRNRDLQALLFTPAATLSAAEKRRRSARVSRQLRLLRAHGLIQKVPHTHRYQVTTAGRLIITAVLTADRSSLAQLKIAA